MVKKSNNLNQLLRNGDVWRASRQAVHSISEKTVSGIATGYASLDRLLQNHGWPQNGLTEIIQDQWGYGEIRLLLPALARLSESQNRWIAIINPPFTPYPPALIQQHIHLEKILIINTINRQDALWSMEKTLTSGCCSAVLAWPEFIRTGQVHMNSSHGRLLPDKSLRRLQLASKTGHSLGVIFRPVAARVLFSPAELRLHIHSSRNPLSLEGETRVDILKRRGGWPTSLSLNLENSLRLLSGQPESDDKQKNV